VTLTDLQLETIRRMRDELARLQDVADREGWGMLATLIEFAGEEAKDIEGMPGGELARSIQ